MTEKLPRVHPEQVGISSRSVHDLIDALHDSGTEMHGLMVLRHGKVAVEGWWSPFAPGLVHGSQSLTKTVTGTAFAIAYKEGILHYNDRMIDIFPEHVPGTPGEYLDELKLIHLLTMSTGMRSMPAVTDLLWQKQFFITPILDKPGTAFFYNSIGCSMVGACIKKKTGLGLREFLRDRLFNKIGINTDDLKWYLHPDGMENGSGGIVSKTEDNARLMQLYLQGGVWDNERILPDDWVKIATSMQNDHFKKTVNAPESGLGYGGMMWIKNETYRADGAMGQYAIGFPNQDMVISINQTVSGSLANRKMLDALYGFAYSISPETLPMDSVSIERTGKMMKQLSIGNPPCSSKSEWSGKIDGRTCKITEGHVSFFAEDLRIFNSGYVQDIDKITFSQGQGAINLNLYYGDKTGLVTIAVDGRRWLNSIKSNIPVTEVALCGFFRKPNELEIEIRWLETCRKKILTFSFSDDGVEIISSLCSVGGFDEPDITAKAVWE